VNLNPILKFGFGIGVGVFERGHRCANMLGKDQNLPMKEMLR
jgi:hypothetical protein